MKKNKKLKNQDQQDDSLFENSPGIISRNQHNYSLIQEQQNFQIFSNNVNKKFDEMLLLKYPNKTMIKSENYQVQDVFFNQNLKFDQNRVLNGLDLKKSKIVYAETQQTEEYEYWTYRKSLVNHYMNMNNDQRKQIIMEKHNLVNNMWNYSNPVKIGSHHRARDLQLFYPIEVIVSNFRIEQMYINNYLAEIRNLNDKNQELQSQIQKQRIENELKLIEAQEIPNVEDQKKYFDIIKLMIQQEAQSLNNYKLSSQLKNIKQSISEDKIQVIEIDRTSKQLQKLLDELDQQKTDDYGYLRQKIKNYIEDCEDKSNKNSLDAYYDKKQQLDQENQILSQNLSQQKNINIKLEINKDNNESQRNVSQDQLQAQYDKCQDNLTKNIQEQDRLKSELQRSKKEIIQLKQYKEQMKKVIKQKIDRFQQMEQQKKSIIQNLEQKQNELFQVFDNLSDNENISSNNEKACIQNTNGSIQDESPEVIDNFNIQKNNQIEEIDLNSSQMQIIQQQKNKFQQQLQVLKTQILQQKQYQESIKYTINHRIRLFQQIEKNKQNHKSKIEQSQLELFNGFQGLTRQSECENDNLNNGVGYNNLSQIESIKKDQN